MFLMLLNNFVDPTKKNFNRQSKDLGSNPSAVESVFFSTERFQILKFKNNLFDESNLNI